jgi:hypothetical protein
VSSAKLSLDFAGNRCRREVASKRCFGRTLGRKIRILMGGKATSPLVRKRGRAQQSCGVHVGGLGGGETPKEKRVGIATVDHQIKDVPERLESRCQSMTCSVQRWVESQHTPDQSGPRLVRRGGKNKQVVNPGSRPITHPHVCLAVFLSCDCV